jgi:formylglycine-generating enzyme required for sulfatase activity
MKREISIELGNGVNLELVYIPGGRFVMGAPTAEEGSGAGLFHFAGSSEAKSAE